MVYIFQDCELDDRSYVLRRSRMPVKVEPKVFEVLVYLIHNRDRFVSRDELFTQIWPNHAVSDAALTRCIAEARKAVGDDGTQQGVIRTQYTRGYRFVAEVEEKSEGAGAPQPSAALPAVPFTWRDWFAVLFSVNWRWVWVGAVLLMIILIGGSDPSWRSLALERYAFFASAEQGAAPYDSYLTAEEQQQANRRFVHLKNYLQAYQHTQRGWESYYRYTPEANARARQLFEQAVQLGPRIASAYIGLGWTYWLEWTWLWSDDPHLLDVAQGYAQQALELKRAVPSAYSLLAAIHLMRQQYSQALVEARHAVDLDPFDAGATALLAEVLIATGQPEGGFLYAQKARRLHPAAAEAYAGTIGHAYRVMGRYEEAIAAFQEALTFNPNMLSVRTQLAAAYSQLGKEEKAWAELRTSLRDSVSLSVDAVKQRIPYQDPIESQRFFAALEKVWMGEPADLHNGE